MKQQSVLWSIIGFLIVTSFIFNSCAPTYVPNVVNAPMLNNQYEFQGNINTGTSGLDYQVAFAPSKKIGVMFNGSYMNSTSDSSDTYHKHNFFEAGVGYYTKFSKDGHFEIFAGYGQGKVDALTDFLSSTIIINSKYNRFFLQPDIGFATPYFDLVFSPRIVYVNVIPYDNLYTKESVVYIEPTGTMRFGYKYFYLTTQAGLSLGVINTQSDTWVEHLPFLFSLGIQVRLGRIYDETARYN